MRVSRTKVLLIATAMVWLTAYTAWTASWMAHPMPHLLERSLRRVLVCLFGFGCCWTMALILDFLALRGWLIRLAAALLLCVVASLLYAAVNTLIFYTIAPLWGATDLIDALQGAVSYAWVFLAWCGLYFAITIDAEARDARLQVAEARSAELRARNQALAQQISPHFLFNALNTVSGLIIDGTPAKAERVVMALAGLLRRSLESDGRERVTLGEEIEAARRYLQIEEARFEDRFVFIEAVPPDLRRLQVAPLILQPLVENAIKHGVARCSRPVTLTIAARRIDSALQISVIDDAVPDSNAVVPSGIGLGQSNVRERLALLYGSAAFLDCGAGESDGYVVRLTLPVEGELLA